MSVLPKALTTPQDLEQEDLACEVFDNMRHMDKRIGETPIKEELQNPTTESSLDPLPGIRHSSTCSYYLWPSRSSSDH